MAVKDFEDIDIRHKAHLKKVMEKGRKLRPVKWAMLGAFALSRLFGFEYKLFCRFLKPMNKVFHDAMSQAFVCSFMKSGTNWMMQVVHQIANRGEGEFKEILHVVAWPDAPAQEITIDINDPRPVQFSKTGLRGIKTHAPADMVPYSDKAKYVCVVRDPKDVAVSAFHFFRSVMLGPLMPTIATWANYMRNSAFGSWSDFTDSYWRWRDRPNVLFITYEEMNDDTTSAIKKIAKLMGVELTEDELAKVVELSSFDYMKSVDHMFYPGEIGPFGDGSGRMVRQGKSKASGEILSVEQQKMIDDNCRERLEELGSDFPYEQHYGGQSEHVVAS
jgi:hypothetical protein